MSLPSKRSLGVLVARLLAGSWRREPPPPDISEAELGSIAHLLHRSGASSLAWHKIRHSPLQAAPDAQGLQQAYRLHSLQAALHERSLKKVIPLLRSFGVEPVVVKGWAIARHYPEPGLRPYSDLDLCLLPDQYASAQKALKSADTQGGIVDLHQGFGKFYDRHADEIFERSCLVKLGDLDVRVLSAEDDLRFLCMHMLRHGAVRPFWLCDIAALLENRGKDFDWDRCLGDSRRQADWVACAIGLAHQLLGAEIAGMPLARRAQELPRWLMPTVLREWGIPFYMPAQVALLLRHPVARFRTLLEELPQHWPNPIEATVNLKGSFNNLPRLPFQVGHIFSRTAALVVQLPKMRRPAGL